MNSVSSISRKEWETMQERAIKDWHFEECNHGVKPIAGKYDKMNPLHIPISEVIKEHP